MRKAPDNNLYNFPIIIEKDEDGIFVASCPILQGCFTQAKSEKEALKRIKEAVELHVETRGIKVDFIPQTKIKAVV